MIAYLEMIEEFEKLRRIGFFEMYYPELLDKEDKDVTGKQHTDNNTDIQ